MDPIEPITRVCSNPLAGTDSALLALSGSGYMGGKLFGFASCPRAVGAAEGMNVLAERAVPVPPEQGARHCNPGSTCCACVLRSAGFCQLVMGSTFTNEDYCAAAF